MAFQLPEDCDHRVHAIYDYWCGLRSGKRLPARRDVDPADVPALLPYLWLTDVERDPPRFRFRLIGSAIVEGLGRDLTGRYFDQCFDNFDGSPPHRTLVEISAKGRPAWRRGPALLTRKDYNVKEMERIILPLASDGETVDLFLALSVYVLDDNRA